MWNFLTQITDKFRQLQSCVYDTPENHGKTKRITHKKANYRQSFIDQKPIAAISEILGHRSLIQVTNTSITTISDAQLNRSVLMPMQQAF